MGNRWGRENETDHKLNSGKNTMNSVKQTRAGGPEFLAWDSTAEIEDNIYLVWESIFMLGLRF